MNFLSHFYFDRERSDPEEVLGGVLPDLIKNANKAWNIHPEKKIHLFDDSKKMRSVLNGWKRHLAVDRYFHSSEFFTEHTQSIRKEIAPILAQSEVRPSFLAHIALELMLDSLLITNDKLNAFKFYEQLALADRKILTQFLELNAIADIARFYKFFDQFLEINYLHRYSESENLVYALNRICMRIWKDPLTEEEKFKLSVVFLDYQDHLAPDFMNIFIDLDDWLQTI